MVLVAFWLEVINTGRERFKNMKTVHTCRYMFLFKDPITYTRPLMFGEKKVTDVKLLVVLYNKTVNHCVVYLYGDGANENVNWDNVMTKKIDYMNLIYNDTLFIENDRLDWCLEYFGLE